MTAPPSLSELLHQSQQLTSHLDPSNLPNIQLGLDQIESQSRKFAGRSSAFPSGPANPGIDSTRSLDFLKNGGVDASTIDDTIQQARMANAFEPLRPIDDTNVAGYLRHEHEQVILSCLEEGRRNTEIALYRTIDRSLDNSWDTQKRRIIEDLGTFTAPSVPGTSTRAAAHNLSVPVRASTSLQMHSKMLRYVRVVQRLNDARLAGELFPLAHAYASAVAALQASAGGTGSTKLLESWRIVQELAHEHDVVNGGLAPGVVAQREYAASYNDPGVYFGSSQGLALRKKLTQGSMRYLEAHFLDHVDASIQRNPVKAQIDDQPTVRSRVAAYCRIKYTGPNNQWSLELETITTKEGRMPIWAFLFFLLRTGHKEDALRLATEMEPALRRTDHVFVGLFKTWLNSPELVLPKSLRDRTFTDFYSRFGFISPGRPAVDPYKLALYKIIGRFEVHQRFPSALTSNSSHWLWLQLSMVREPPVNEGQLPGASALVLDDSGIKGSDTYTLGDLASTVTTYGADHFDPKGTSPYNYFQLLLLVGQFERAVAFLYSRPTAQADAVQFAITLSYYGLLRVPEASKSSQLDYLTVDSACPDLTAAGTPATLGVSYFDFAHLIERYTRSFVESDPQEALQHVYLVALNDDVQDPIADEQMARCLSMVRQVVLDSKDYYTLLGDPRNDGSTTPGTIFKYSKLLHIPDATKYLVSIVGAAASAAEEAGQTKDAVLLYNLAGQYEKVIAVLNSELSKHLMVTDSSLDQVSPSHNAGTDTLAPGTSLQAAPDLSTLALEILSSYRIQPNVLRAIQQQKLETLRLLLDFKLAVAKYKSGHLEEALGMIEATDMIPLQADATVVSHRADEWKMAEETLSSNLPQLLLMVMTILARLHATLRASLYSHPHRQRFLIELRNKARTLLSFVGLLRYRLPSDAYSQLLSLAPQ